MEQDNWKTTTIVLGIIVLGLGIGLTFDYYTNKDIYNFKELTGEDWKISKWALNDFYEQNGNPMKVCRFDNDYCLVIHKLP